MSSSKNKGKKAVKKLEKEKLLLQMKEEIESLERQIKYSKLINFKNSSVKNLKITARALQLVTPYVLTASIVAGGFSLLGVTPFARDKKEIHYSTMTEFDNLGNIRYEQQYGDFGENNVFKFYSKWQLQEDGFYTRTLKTYSTKEKTYEELLELFNKDNISLEDILGEPTSTIKETQNNLSEDEINKEAFMQAIIYNKDENDFIIQEESISENIGSTILYFVAVAVTETLPLRFRNEVSNFDFSDCVQRIKKKYKTVDIKELTRKLEIRRDNYKRMTR